MFIGRIAVSLECFPRPITRTFAWMQRKIATQNAPMLGKLRKTDEHKKNRRPDRERRP
jgi:hypothetical protein